MSSKKSGINNQMFRQLAHSNVKKNAKNYMVYIVTLMFSVAMLYTFNSIGSQFSMLNLPDRGSYLSFSVGMMAGASVFISAVMAFLVAYANRFLMRRRKKELGIYITLGMTQKDLSRLMFRETVIIGAFSLGAGLLLGIFLAQGLAFVTIRFLQVEGAAYRFVISPLAILECVVFYVLMFAFMNSLNKKSLKKSSLRELLYADKKNEILADEGNAGNIIKIIVAAICFVAAYFLSISNGFDIKYIGAGIVLIFIGTFLFFKVIANVLLYWIHRRKRLYYKDLNMFAIHQISSKMNSTNTTLSIICILLFLSFTTLAVGLGLSMSVTAGLDKMTSADAVVASYGKEGEPDGETSSTSIQQYLEGKGVPLEAIASNTVEAVIYRQEDVALKDFLLEGTPGKSRLGKNEYLGWNQSPGLMGISDYNRLRSQQGLKPIALEEGTCLINYNVIQLDGMYQYFSTQKDAAIVIGGKKLSLAKKGLQKLAYQNANLLADTGTIIVPDDMLQGRQAENRYLNINFDPSNPDAEAKFQKAMYDLYDTGLTVVMKSLIVTEITSTNMTLSYIAVYLGIIFLVCACAVLALQQIAGAADNVKRYDTLRSLGAEEKHIRKTLLAQIAIYFGVPLLVALLHSAAAINVMYQRMGNITVSDAVQNILFALVILTGVYGSYFLITYINSRNTLNVSS